MIKNVDKDQFKFINEDIVIKDEAFKTKPIGYYKDAWLRFKKNKASVVAAVIIMILLAFTLVGPHLKNSKLDDNNFRSIKLRYEALPPKIKGLENIGIFDGTKEVRGMSKGYYDSLPDGIVLKIIDDGSNSSSGTMVVKVNYYRYLQYSEAFGTGLVDGKPGKKITTLNKREYDLALERNAVVSLEEISGQSYRVQLDIFRYVFDEEVDDVYFWFGTTKNGDDLFSMLWKGSQISLLIALSVTIINILIGLILGSIVGYYGATLDIVFERIVDILANIPFLVILTLLLLRFGSTFGVIIFAFVSTGWIGSYGTTRIQTYRYKNREYVLAARSYGAKDGRIIRKHILPNALGTLITSFSLMIPRFIFTESTYSYLGIINYPGVQSVGRLLADGQNEMQRHFHLLLFPALYLSLLMLSFNLFSNGLRDAFNPSLRGVEE